MGKGNFLVKLTSILAVFLFTTILSCGQSTTADSTVFGINLGAKFVVPECSLIKKTFIYAENDPFPCFERFRITEEEKRKRTAPIINGTVTVCFPFGKRPTIMSNSKLSAGIVDGNLESVGFNTGGYEVQEQVFASLKEKYGDPSETHETKKQNRTGASYSSLFAVWTFDNLVVTFQGMTDRIDSGLVNIDTKKGYETRMAALKKLHDGPKL